MDNSSELMDSNSGIGNVVRQEARLVTIENSKQLLQKFDAVDPREILAKEGIRYLQTYENNCELLRFFDSSSSPYYRDNIAEFADLSMRYGYLLRSGAMAPLGIGPFGNEIGYGLITLVDLKKDDFIGQYSGVIQVSDGGLGLKDGQSYSSDYAWDYPDFPEDWPEIEISAGNAGNALRYANHSFEPNCRVEHTLLDGTWQLFFLADQDIIAGTQLLVNYGEEYWGNGMRELLYI